MSKIIVEEIIISTRASEIDKVRQPQTEGKKDSVRRHRNTAEKEKDRLKVETERRMSSLRRRSSNTSNISSKLQPNKEE